MNAKYNKYYIILICLLCNSIIAISEQQSLIDKPIVDNILSNDPVSSTKQSIKISKKSKVLKRKKKNLRKTALRKSLKSNKNKKVINKSKVSPLLSKGAKISLGAIGVGGVGLLIRPSRKTSTSSSTNHVIGTSPLSNQGEIFQESGSKTLLDNSSNIPLEQEQYFSLNSLKDLNNLFNELQEKEFKYYINLNELTTINRDFRKLNIDDKMKLILDCLDMDIIYTITVRNTSFNINLESYLISLMEQNEINQILETLKIMFCGFYKCMISRYLKLWDIILEHSQKQEKQELFYILYSERSELITKKQAEITQIVQNMISNNKDNDLLILLLIFNQGFYKIIKNEEELIDLSDYLLSKLQPEEKPQLLSEMDELSEEELKMYNIDSNDINQIKESLQPTISDLNSSEIN